MVLSKKIENVIDKEYQLIINDIPLADYLYDLRSIGLISDDEVIKLRDDCKNNKERVFEFLKILKSRSDENFFQFCCILKESQVRHIQDIGKALEIEANIPNKHSKSNYIPHILSVQHVFISTICSSETFPLASSSQSVSEYSSSENSPSKNPSSENFPLVNPPLENLLLETSSSEIPVLEFSTSDLSLAKSSSSQISILDFDVPENLLRNLPPTPSNHYVMRKDAVNTICDQLKIINDLSGHLLIHGMAGSGKTVTVCQSVRQAAKRGYFKSNGCYWMKIVNSRISDTLFIFDDIWIKDHYNYLSFAKKSIATSRFLYYENELTHYCIRLPEQLAFDEAIELLSLHRHDRDTQVLRDNPIIKNVIDSCAGLPLAINLIGGLHLDTNEDWNKAKAIISNKSKKVRLANYNFNLHGTLQLSVESIEENDRRLFESLVVFKRVNIPIESIASLWNCDEQDTDDLLVEMNNKSLLRYVRGNK
ncbi:uncharacterized protein TRIADDRAFT_61940 [Trichoplax adhaerens]|uniref:CARD domain-containing protein n=1 Tax=Trichoplax adhaerens TaxID=10228 RepID=B3SCE1_TRIAD|nr:predicted protein [Trichoplax adhaerens]EDV19574.1 predicted protein [Trichoplax adhaerens]|eukprot:XP_002117907.1 predicted protein [Trichoplax adhaerens]